MCTDNISETCSVELWAESMAPSRICAQLQFTTTLPMLIFVSGEGWNTGGSNGGISSAGPIQVQMNPAASCVGYALCFTLRVKLLSAGSDGISSTVPSAATFQP